MSRWTFVLIFALVLGTVVEAEAGRRRRRCCATISAACSQSPCGWTPAGTCCGAVNPVCTRCCASYATAAENPTITALVPNPVEQGWEGTLKVYGSGFDQGSFVLIDGHVPPKTYKSEGLIEVAVTREITVRSGDKVVKVHTAAGGLSNEKRWTLTGTTP